EAGASVPAGWVAITINAARRAAVGEAMAGSVSASALALAEGAIRAMKIHPWKQAAAAIAATLVVAGAAVFAQAPGGPQEAPRAENPQVKQETPRAVSSQVKKYAGVPPETVAPGAPNPGIAGGAPP